MPEEHVRLVELQQRLREMMNTFFHQDWPPNPDNWYWSDKGFVADFVDTAFMLQKIEVTSIERADLFTILHTRVIASDIDSVRDIQNCVHHVLSRVDESFFIFMPLHDKEHLRFWYMTGTTSHRHEGMIIFERSQLPQIKE